MKKFIPLLLVVLFYSLFWVFLKRTANVGKAKHVDSPALVETVSSPEPVAGKEGSAPPIHLPTLSRIREEVAADPHGTPASLLIFASQLSPRLKVAMNNEAEANLFVSDLESCVLSDVELTPSTVRALCIRHVKLLQRRFPSLYEKGNSLLMRADSRALELAE